MVQSQTGAEKKGDNVAHLGADDPEMVLGIIWRPSEDILGF